MKKFGIDLPVLMIFFTRPSTLEKVFEKVKEARPSKLFLACDGPREDNERDNLAIEQCKKIVENIDWECEVYKRYSDVNLGCGKGPASAISWALSIVDRIVILEDDCVPDQTFFPYMQELLERYKNDERIGMISGLNHLKDWDCGGDSYCFVKTGAIWGWGTWNRVWKNYDYSVSDINKQHLVRLMQNNISNKTISKNKINRWTIANKKVEAGEKISYWDVQFGFLMDRFSYLGIVPKHNLICNIGVGEGSTHADGLYFKEWKRGRLHYIPTKSIESPLSHPKYIVYDRKYDYVVNKTFLEQSVFRIWFGKIKRGLKRIFKIKR